MNRVQQENSIYVTRTLRPIIFAQSIICHLRGCAPRHKDQGDRGSIAAGSGIVLKSGPTAQISKRT
jgi:hypothetical protein